ncbi:MAG: hypothetical protein HY721_20175 [Planctomycetes bacterium]|nr:hypothetical protein [Planctomycetota bacterium]
MRWLHELILGNWRNKGVALFFAVTIWYAAYQSEKQSFSDTFRVDVRPAARGQNMVITGVQTLDSRTGDRVEFDGRARMSFSGPRKQIDKLRDEKPVGFLLQVPREKEVVVLRQEDFGFPKEGVEIVQFSPESLRVNQEEAVTQTVKNLVERLQVSNVKDGFEVASKDVSPASVQVTGPKSVVDRIVVSLHVPMDRERERFDGKVDVTLACPDEASADLVKRTVMVKPTEVRVVVALQASTDVLPVDAVKLTFRVPPLKAPVKLVLDDIVGDTIPVEFHGRKDEIGRLRDRLRDQPGFSLGVRVPSFDWEQGGQFTFTEDALELHGFPGVQIRQHESRRKDKKTAWSYTVVPVKEAER